MSPSLSHDIPIGQAETRLRCACLCLCVGRHVELQPGKEATYNPASLPRRARRREREEKHNKNTFQNASRQRHSSSRAGIKRREAAGRREIINFNWFQINEQLLGILSKCACVCVCVCGLARGGEELFDFLYRLDFSGFAFLFHNVVRRSSCSLSGRRRYLQWAIMPCAPFGPLI